MIKHYCDVCGKLVKRNYFTDRLKVTLGKIKLEVMLGMENGDWNKGDICHKCLIDVLVKGIEKEEKKENA